MSPVLPAPHRRPTALAAATLLLLTGCGGDDAQGDPGVLCINEFMASNAETVQDESGAAPDWIEIFNPSDEEVSLSLVYLTDDLNVPQMASLDPTLVVPPLGYLLFWADGDSTEGSFHLPFSLAKDGEEIGLAWFDGTTVLTVDAVTYDVQETDISMAREPDGTENWVAAEDPTPGSTNGAR